jgi:hypothetical protein
VVIFLLVPVRMYIIPRLPFTPEELAILDGPTASSFVSYFLLFIHVIWEVNWRRSVLRPWPLLVAVRSERFSKENAVKRMFHAQMEACSCTLAAGDAGTPHWDDVINGLSMAARSLFRMLFGRHTDERTAVARGLESYRK